ncbi:MAG TPA: glycosyltransferase family 4 protein [Chloroflexota bacterium]|nr:glycosyltransferase family 4 protein [Chloroflexota bacterium]
MSFDDLFWRPRRKMRVLMTTDAVGGVWTYTTHLVGALVNRDVQVTMVSLGALPNKNQLRDLESLPGVELIPTPFKLEWMKDSEADVDASKRFIMDVAEQVKPDIFHTNQFCFATLRLDVPKILVAHSDMLSWWSWRFHKGASDFAMEPFLVDYRQKVQRALLSADTVVCPSAFMAENLSRFYDPGLQRLCVIYNGIPTGDTSRDLRKKRRIAVSVGRLWDEGKNAECVIQAARSLPDLEFLMIGPTKGPDGNKLKSTPPANVKLLGQLPPKTVWKLLGSAGIYIGPSLYEPFGLAPLEAAVSNCALVLSDIPSFKEIWEDAALYFPPDAPDVLAERLRFMIDKPDVVCRHATMARFRAFRFYTTEKMAEQYHGLYVALISSAGGKVPLPQNIQHAH